MLFYLRALIMFDIKDGRLDGNDYVKTGKSLFPLGYVTPAAWKSILDLLGGVIEHDMNHEDVKNIDAHSSSEEGAVVCDSINRNAGL